MHYDRKVKILLISIVIAATVTIATVITAITIAVNSTGKSDRVSANRWINNIGVTQWTTERVD